MGPEMRAETHRGSNIDEFMTPGPIIERILQGIAGGS